MTVNGVNLPLRLILPVLPDVDVSGSLELTSCLVGETSRLVLVGVVVVPIEQPIAVSTAAARALRRQLRTLARSVPPECAVDVTIRAAASLEEGIRQVAAEGDAWLILPLPATGAEAALSREPYANLVDYPACDTVLVRAHSFDALRRMLVAAARGPNAELALAVGRRLAHKAGAQLTVMHVDVPREDDRRRRREQDLFRSLIAKADDGSRVIASNVPADSAEDPVLAEAERHDAVVLGAFIGPVGQPGFLGELPASALARSSASVLVVKSRAPVHPAMFRPSSVPVDVLVESWFVEHTMHCRDYADLEELVAEKRARGLTVGVALIAGASHDTFSAFGRVLLDELHSGVSLVDQVAVFSPQDAAVTAGAAAAGFDVHEVPDTSPDQYGRLLRASLHALHTDVVVWLDADMRNPHAKLVYGLIGPLIQNERVHYVKGFHQLPPEGMDADLLDLVDEFAARPLLNLFFADLSGIIDPLGTDHAIRRRTGLSLPLFTGTAAPVGLLIDVADRHGLDSIAQVALEERIARRPDLAEARRRAFSAAQVIAARLGLAAETAGGDRRTPSIRHVFQNGDRLQIGEIDARKRSYNLTHRPERDWTHDILRLPVRGVADASRNRTNSGWSDARALDSALGRTRA